ncbi:MAG TPA: sensor histidine kinase [Thermoanaerobaculia bacterium]|nr:sensor histidine kinase [Thermoanaerobaculia bacterium]
MTTSTDGVIRPDYAPHARAERLIATGRFVLALSSLTAVYLEPSTPAQYQRATYTLLVVYTVYALLAATVAWRSPVPSARWRLVSHALDLLLFTVFVYLTEGPASPFFLYFVFSLFCATLRFSWRGILATGIAAMAIYGVMAVLSSYTDPQFEASRAVIRIAYLGVLAALLVYLGVYQQQLRTELASLAAWPRELAADRDDVLSVTLRHAATVLRARRVLLVWEEPEEPWVHTAIWNDGGLHVDRMPPGAWDAPALDAVRNTSVFARADAGTMLVYDPAHPSVVERTGDPIGPALRERYAIDSAIAVSLQSETLAARFIVPDVRSATADDLALAHISGRLALATLEQFFFVQQVRQTASAEERLRISRDLHDGIVQSLAGVGLTLQTLRSRVAHDSDLAGQLVHIQDVLERDQRELRTIVRELRPHDVRDGHTIVAHELQRMRERFPLEWGLEVEVDAPDRIDVAPRLAHELCRIVNESLSNAARHGGASRAVVSARSRDAAVELHIRDNGRGFPFSGRHDLAAMEHAGHGPRTLKERVRNLGGSLVVESSNAGAAIEVRIPLQEAN